jgi:hypothetical protein
MIWALLTKDRSKARVTKLGGFGTWSVVVRYMEVWQRSAFDRSDHASRPATSVAGDRNGARPRHLISNYESVIPVPNRH